jgi:pyruvate,orthophosphate dikinase
MADEGLITEKKPCHAHRSGLARPAAAPDHRPERRRARHHRRACRPRRARRRARSCSPPKRRKRPAAGRKVILVRVETSPEDIHGMHAAEGILTTRGGMTSHAAVVARGMGTPCVSAPAACRSTMERHHSPPGPTLKGRRHHHRRRDRPGCWAKVAMLQPELSGDFGLIMEWADATRPHEGAHQRRNPADARARDFGAEGIGLCRTEHMFFEGDRITAMREMILAETRTAAARRWPSCCRCSAGLHRAVRDHAGPAGHHPPARSAAARVPAQDRRRRSPRSPRPSAFGGQAAPARRSDEFNPMLGHRGCRLAISYPEIAEMQARAIFEAAVEAGAKPARRWSRKSWCRWSVGKAELDLVRQGAIDATAEAVQPRPASRSSISRHHDRTAARGAPAGEIAESASSSPSAPTT